MKYLFILLIFLCFLSGCYWLSEEYWMSKEEQSSKGELRYKDYPQEKESQKQSY